MLLTEDAPMRVGAVRPCAPSRVRLTYSDHAWDRTDQRHVPAGAPEAVVAHSWRRRPERNGKLVYTGRVQGRFLRVVVVPRPFAPHVVTVYWVHSPDA